MQEDQNLAPICLFTYNRPSHTLLTIEHLKKNPEASSSILFIFCDGAKDEKDETLVEVVRKIARETQLAAEFKEVRLILSETNKGLAASIIAGVTQVLKEFDQVIVLEDDLITSPYFLKYMNMGLQVYKDENQVASIHAYIYPTADKLPDSFFLRGADCWGWATWRRAWQHFEINGEKLLAQLEAKGLSHEFDFYSSYPYTEMLKRQIRGENNSWAIRWYASAFLRNMLTLYPGQTLVKNIGLDGSGTHGISEALLNSEFALSPFEFKPISIQEDIIAKQIISEYFRSIGKPQNFIQRTLIFFTQFLKKLLFK